MDDKAAWAKVMEILRRGNKVEISTCKDGIQIAEISRKIVTKNIEFCVKT